MDRSPGGSSKLRSGESGGNNLPNIVEERSEELTQSFRGLSGASTDSASQPKDSISTPPPQQSAPLPNDVRDSTSQVAPTTARSASGPARPRNPMGDVDMESTYTVPLNEGGSSQRRFQKPRPLKSSLNDPATFKFKDDDEDDDNSDGGDLEAGHGNPSNKMVKSSSGSTLGSFFGSPGRRPRPLSRNAQFRSSVGQSTLPTIPIPSANLRRSLSLGNQSASTGSNQESIASPADKDGFGLGGNGSTTTPGGSNISSLNLGAGTVGFTSNLSRKSQNFRHSIAKRSGGALARLKRHGSSLEDGPGEIGRDAQNKAAVYRYSIGDPVLIINHNSRWANCVNRHGFPAGRGNSSDEQRGPYIYVLGTVKTIHYEENAVFYTVTRVDTGNNVRGDPDFMEPILNQAGVEAARQAATEFAMGTSLEDEGEDETDNAPAERNESAFKALENIVEVLLLPLFLAYDLFVFAIGARLFRWAETVFIFTKRQAHSFLHGVKPYECSATLTAVNIIVLCSIWYMFVDQARLAFLPTNADYSLAVINFVIWCILTLELVFEVFIRPDDYHALIQSDKAFIPTTVRFISGLHLAVEAISLGFFVPEFLCLFQSDLMCDERPKFSFLYATILAITGPTRLYAFAGRALYASIRLRVFGLVRHWKNMWVNTKYLKRQKQKEIERKIRQDNKSQKFRDEGDTRQSQRAPNIVRMEQRQRNLALINASNIGTALMVTNSYRALTILVMILGIFPMITLIYFNGVVNSVATEMVDQLHGTNLLVTVESDSSCHFLVDSVAAWASSLYTRNYNLITSPTDDFLVALVIQPARCQEQFESVTVGNLQFFLTSCSTLESQYAMHLDEDSQESNVGCIVGALKGTKGGSLRSIADHFKLRSGNFQNEQSPSSMDTLSLADGSSFDTKFQVSACFNQTHAIESSALASFVLQFCLLMTVLGGLAVLRRDAEDMVLAPLRSMLKIVARYAKNPLAQAATSGGDNRSVISESESEASTSRGSDGDGSDGDGFGTYETEQLITAVAKITDLLRKCWGVAGADIISTNLASREGALAEVFNPTVPGKSVYALFAFAAINGFDHALKCLGGDVMILINDVARVLHDEVYRWGFGDSGQCNKNLGAAFLMVFRIGLVKEVVEKLEEATKVVFSTSDAKKSVKKKNKLMSPAHVRSASEGNKVNVWARLANNNSNNNNNRSMPQLVKSKASSAHEHDAMADAMKLSLQSLPGIATFTDRAIIGMLKSFAGIHRDNKLRGWSRDFRLSAGVGAFEVNMIFGMDAGWAVEGAVGSEYKIDATYLSPHVNMASRMMSACKHYGVTILLSEAVQELMSDNAKGKLRNVDRVTVKGSVRIQKIFTFDARHKGADFFLFSRSEDLADIDADQYVPSIWNTDQDLRAMRHHVTDDFESEFNAGMKAYYAGDWPAAIRRLESANEIMVDAAMEEGYLHDEMDDTPDRKELYRNETADGPCSYLVHFMKSKGGKAPDGWAGWHPLLSK